MFYVIALLHLIREFCLKNISLYKQKNFNRLIDLFFEISLDIKFPMWGDILQIVSTIIRNSINHFEGFFLITSYSSY